MDHNRLSRWSSGARRICFQKQKSQTAAELNAEIGTAVQSVEQGKEPEAIQEVKNIESALHGLKENLKEPERQLIYENLGNLVERTTDKKMEALRKKAEELRESVAPAPRGQFSVPPQRSKSTEAASKTAADTKESVKEEGKIKKAMNWTKEKLNNIGKWSKDNPGKTALIGTATLGLLGLAVWLSRKKKKATNEGGSKWRWLLWVPVVGAVGYGIVRAHEYMIKNVKPYQDTIAKLQKEIEDLKKKGEEVGKSAIAAKQGLESGKKTVVDNVNESFADAGENTRRTLERQRNNEFESNEEYYNSLFSSLILDGVTVIFIDGTCYLYKNGKQILSNSLDVGMGLFNAANSLYHGDGNTKDKIDGCVKLYAETALVYAASFGVMDFVWLSSELGIKKGLKNALLRSAKWPYEVYRKTGLKTGLALCSGGPNGVIARTELETLWRKPQFHWKRVKYGKIGSLFGTWEEAHLNSLYDEWLAYNRMIKNVEKKEGTSLLIQTLDNRWERVESNLKKGIYAFYDRTGKVPSFIEEVGDPDLIRQIKRRQIVDGHLKSVLEKGSIDLLDDASEAVEDTARIVDSTADEAVAGKIDPDAPESTRTPPPSDVDADGRVRIPESEAISDAPADLADDAAELADDADRAIAGKIGSDGIESVDEVADGADDAARAVSNTDEVAETVGKSVSHLDDTELGRAIEHFGGSKCNANDFLKYAEVEGLMDKNTVKLINGSPGAKKIFEGALKIGDKVEVNRAIEAAKGVSKWSIAGNVAGIGADAFGLYMAYADWQANGERIAETSNPALQELYSDANNIYAVEGGSSAMGLAIGGHAIVTTYLATGGTVLKALAAPAGTVMLPIGLAVAGTRYYYKELEAAQEGWLKDASDWQKEDNAAVLAEIERLAPGSSTVGQRVSTTEHLGYQTKAARERNFKELEKNNMQEREALYEAYFRKNTVLPKEEGESDKDYRERLNTFVRNQVLYISRVTDGDYRHILDVRVLESASYYSEMAERGRKAKLEGRKDIIRVPGVDGSVVELDLAEFGQDLSPANTISYANEYKKVMEENEFQNLLVLANRVGQGGKMEDAAVSAINNILLGKLRHRINKFEVKVR
ncbi:hypothetical protein KJ918_06170, partial [Patescibacteria group bacterium]|nr:hypothetical protein [Patescibacteria group bacterium]